MKKFLFIACAITFLATASFAQSTTAPWSGYAKLSPFEAVSWQGEVPDVRVSGIWFELVSLNDWPANKIVSACQALGGKNWQKRFEEDLVEVLTRSGHEPGLHVTLQVRELTTGNDLLLKEVPMTEENRRTIMDAKRAKLAPPSTQP
jgi:hypothetical protein